MLQAGVEQHGRDAVGGGEGGAVAAGVLTSEMEGEE
jgi:hypothetical protein